jgi:fido (protein-threonine AMPylation protein)
MLCTSKIHPFSLGNHLGTSLLIGNLMIIRVTSVEWTWIGLSGLLSSMLSCTHDVVPHVVRLNDAKRHTSLLSNFLLDISL